MTFDRENAGAGMGGEELVEHLARLLASRGFAGSKRLHRFVRYTVDAVVDGRADCIKEYVLGREVFDRGEDYDPRIDPIVRVEAGRLRAKLDEYYRGPGVEESFRLCYPKGSYVPSFARKDSATDAGGRVEQPEEAQPGRSRWLPVAMLVAGATVATIAWWLSVSVLGGDESQGQHALSGPGESRTVALAVLPLEGYDHGSAAPVADLVTEALITELAKLPGLEVRSRTSVMQYRGAARPIGEIADELQVGVLVEGGVVVNGDQLLLKIRLVDGARDRKVWAHSYTTSSGEIVALQGEVALAIAAAAKKVRPLPADS